MHLVLMLFFVKAISKTIQDRNFTFGIDTDLLSSGIENGHSPVCSSLYCSFFFLFTLFGQIHLHKCKSIFFFDTRLRLGLSWFNWWVSFAPEFQCCYSCESSCLFYRSFNSDFYVSKVMHL